MVDRSLLRLSATLSFVGLVVVIVAGIPHPGGGPTYEATFSAYAASANWVSIHLEEFVGMTMLLAALMLVYFALKLEPGTARWLGFCGAVSAGAALALAAALSAVDGVANKQVDVAWVNALPADQTARLASAEAIRWLEWGLSSYQDFVWGLAMLLLGVVIMATARVSRFVGVLMSLAGVGWIVTGWIIGVRGFGPHAKAIQVSGLFLLGWIVWMLIDAWILKGSSRATAT